MLSKTGTSGSTFLFGKHVLIWVCKVASVLFYRLKLHCTKTRMKMKNRPDKQQTCLLLILSYKIIQLDNGIISIHKKFANIHCKKRLMIFPSPAGMSLTKLSLDGNNLIIPGQAEFGPGQAEFGK